MYLRRLEAIEGQPVAEGAAALRAALRGDCHAHSTWSDGGSPIGEMAEAARDLGHEYLVLTDHSPRLTVANGLSPERLLAQLDEVARAERGAGARSGSSPGSRSTSSRTAGSTRPTSCWAGSTSWWPASTPSCACPARR